jgi:DNA polymerase I-like protein with 3'-5' exonuclease and polymerase domains
MNIYPNLSSAKLVSFDVETKDPGIKTSRLSAFDKTGYVLGFSVGTDDGFRAYYPLRHPDGGNLDREKTLAWLRDAMATNVPKVGANILYDLEWARLDLGVSLRGPKICVQATEALIDENRKSYSLDSLARLYLSETKVEDALLAEADRLSVPRDELKANLWRFSAEAVRAYGEGDADLPIRILQKQLSIIKEQELERIYKLESEILDVLLEMRIRGVRVDEERARRLSVDLRAKEDAARLDLTRLAGWDVDVWSGQDVERAAQKLGLPYPTTEKHNPSFKSDWLDGQTHPLFVAVKAARRFNRANEVFVKAKVLDLAHDGRLHCSYYSTRNDNYGTVTGRLSSANPNLQQIPARDEEIGPLIRSIFIPEEGQDWEVYDYSQQEPRVMVHYACLLALQGSSEARRRYVEDPDTDYHQMVADMARISRKDAKTINLGLAYGMGKTKLALNLGRKLTEAAELFDRYHAAVPYVKKLADRCTRTAEQRGRVKTVFGRRSRFDLWGPAAYNKDSKPLPWDEAVALYGPCVKRWFTYKALNRIIQGSSADMVKQAMVDVFRETGLAPVVTVHDENDYSNSDRDVSRKIHRLMLDCVKLEVPLKIDYERGPSWGECKKEEL